MQNASFIDALTGAVTGAQIYELAAEIYPICRSITGNGVRETLRRLACHIPLDIHEVRSGTVAFDWTVPLEWNIRDAYIKDAQGNRIVDFQASNLHVVSYSSPVHGHFQRDELLPHIFTLPDQPDLIPYRTSYYKETWGFCMAHNHLKSLPDGLYEVVINSSLAQGSLTYGEYRHQGESDQEILLSAHICHPSLANDNCSGLALLTHLAKHLAGHKTRYSYRFIFAPGTIGCDRLAGPKRTHDIAYLAWAGGLLRRRCGRPDLQEKPPREQRNRPSDLACSASRRTGWPCRRIFALWI